jgi:hypothetical protein
MAQSRLGWSLEQFMSSTLYFYFGMMEQWALANGAKRKNRSEPNALTFDQLPKDFW